MDLLSRRTCRRGTDRFSMRLGDSCLLHHLILSRPSMNGPAPSPALTAARHAGPQGTRLFTAEELRRIRSSSPRTPATAAPARAKPVLQGSSRGLEKSSLHPARRPPDARAARRQRHRGGRPERFGLACLDHQPAGPLRDHEHAVDQRHVRQRQAGARGRPQAWRPDPAGPGRVRVPDPRARRPRAFRRRRGWPPGWSRSPASAALAWWLL